MHMSNHIIIIIIIISNASSQHVCDNAIAPNAASTPAQQVARNKLRATRNLLRATSNLLRAASCLLPARNLLRATCCAGVDAA